MKTRKKITKKIILITVITGLILAIPLGLWLFPVRDIQEYTTALVQKVELTQTVSEVGSVKSAQEIELSFGQSGKLDELKAKIGDHIEKDQLLAKLDHQILMIQRDEAESSLAAAKANLNKTRSGATREEIEVAESQAEAAKNNYYAALSTLEKTESKVQDSIAQAEKSLSDLESDDPNSVTSYEQSVSSAEKDLENTKRTYQNSINNKKNTLVSTIDSKLAAANTALDEVDGLINNDDLQDYLSSKDTSYLVEANTYYEEAEELLAAANTSFALAQGNRKDAYIDQSAEDALAALNKTADTLDLTFKALEYSSFSQTDEDAYKAGINSEITNIASGISSLETAIQNLADARLTYETSVSSAEETLKKAQASLADAITAARNSLSTARTSGDKEIAAAEAGVTSAKESWDVAESQLRKLKAPARYEDIELYESQVKQAQSALDLIDKQIEDSIIKSPIDGRVVDINYEIGEQITQLSPVISVLADNDLEIEVDISESDISKVKVGNPAEITLDAFGQDMVFNGLVEFIEPAETVIQDVIYYKVTVVFNEDEDKLEEVKSGMTANVDLTTNIKSDVLVVPSRAILEKDGKRYIRVWENGKAKEHEVKTGLRGDGGLVEVFNHVQEGDEVVTYAKENKKRVFRYY